MRTHYWSCSKFANWLRGTDKPYAATGPEWKAWRQTAQSAHKFRYWLAEDGLSYLQGFVNYIPDKLYAVKYYINNRWVTRTHALTAHPSDIKPGDWCDVGNRFLPCLFNELVDFVEVEQAWHNIAWNEEGRKKYQPPFYALGWFRWRTWRSAESGLDSLRWAANLVYDEGYGINPGHPDYGKPTEQAIHARECINLYLWWKEVRPNRPDPHDVSGWTDYCDSNRADGEDLFDRLGADEDPTDTRRRSDMIKEMHDLEERFEQEDEDMMIRLIKLRRYLWT